MTCLQNHFRDNLPIEGLMDRSDMKLHQRSTWSQCETECQWPWRCPNYLTLYRIHDRLALLGFGRHQDFTERYANSFISFSIDYLDTVPTHKLSKSTYGFGRKTTLTFMYSHPAIHWVFFYPHCACCRALIRLQEQLCTYDRNEMTHGIPLKGTVFMWYESQREFKSNW